MTTAVKQMMADWVVGSFDELAEKSGSFKKGETILVDERRYGYDRCLLCGIRRHGWRSWFRLYPGSHPFTVCPRCRQTQPIEKIYEKLIENSMEEAGG